MKGHEIESFYREKLVPGLPNVWIRGRLAAFPPLRPLLRGFYLDASSDPEVVYPYVFVLPLFVPRDHLTFTNMLDIRRRGQWLLRQPQTRDELAELLLEKGAAHLERLWDVSSLAEHLGRALSGGYPNEIEALAHCLVWLGRFDEAIPHLQWLSSLEINVDDPEYFSDIRNRSVELLRLGDSAGRDKLQENVRATAAALKLPEMGEH